MELFKDTITLPTFTDIANGSEDNTSFQQRILSPIMNGVMQGKLTILDPVTQTTTITLDGVQGLITAIAGSIGGWTIDADGLKNSGITIDGTNRQILINDGSNDRVLIGYQSGGF
jgi:hypothetical protein